MNNIVMMRTIISLVLMVQGAGLCAKPQPAKKAFNKMGKGITTAAKDTGKFFSNTFAPKIKIPKDALVFNNNTSQPIHVYQVAVADIARGKEKHIRTIDANKQSYLLRCHPDYIYVLKQSNKSLNATKKGKMERLNRQGSSDYIMFSPEADAKYALIKHGFSALDHGHQIIINNAKQGIAMASSYSVHTADYKGNGSMYQNRALTMGLVSAAVFIAGLVLIVLTMGAATPLVVAAEGVANSAVETTVVATAVSIPVVDATVVGGVDITAIGGVSAIGGTAAQTAALNVEFLAYFGGMTLAPEVVVEGVGTAIVENTTLAALPTATAIGTDVALSSGAAVALPEATVVGSAAALGAETTGASSLLASATAFFDANSTLCLTAGGLTVVGVGAVDVGLITGAIPVKK